VTPFTHPPFGESEELLKADRSRDRHLDTRAALDFLEYRMEAGERRRIEEHLGRPCDTCRERLRQLGELLTSMRDDRAGEVPRFLHERAVGVFAPAGTPSPARRFVDAIAELLFDSSVTPMTIAARRTVGEARRMRFSLGTDSVEFELNKESDSMMSVSGRLRADDARLWLLEVEAGGERRSVHPDAAGGFVLNGLPRGLLTLRLRGEAEHFSLPTIEF
jgi:hypothetical protein